MSDTLVRAMCGCTVKRGQHVYDQRVYTVEIYNREGRYLESLDVPASSERAAKSRLVVRLYREHNISVRRMGWLLVPAGYVTSERECCRDARQCYSCTMRADNPA